MRLFLIYYICAMAKNNKYTVKDYCTCLEQVAPLSLQENYDNAGLIIGNKQQEVKNVLLSLDCTEDIVDEAIARNCQLIIAHHPIVFSGLKKINNTHYVERAITKAIKNDIALYACHTNIDNVINGVNNKIAQQLGLENLSILAPKSNQLVKLFTYVPEADAPALQNAIFEAGAGHIGDYSECGFQTNGVGTFKPLENTNPTIGKKNKRSQVKETKLEVILPLHKVNDTLAALKTAHPYEEVAYEIIKLNNSQGEIGSGLIGFLPKALSQKALLELVKNKMKAKGIRYTAADTKKYKKIAVCGGSGSFLTHAAIAAGADAFITADVKYHEFFEADKKLAIIDIGHYESEQYTPRLFYDILSKKFPTFALHLSKINSNPIKYF